MPGIVRLLALLGVCFAAAHASAHEIVARPDLDGIFAASEVVVRGEVVQVAAPWGSEGPTEVSILVHATLKGEAPRALTFAAPEEHGSRWTVRDRGYFFLAANGRRGAPFATVALHVESPRYTGEAWKAIDGWLLPPGGRRSREQIRQGMVSDVEAIRRHAAWLGSRDDSAAGEGISLQGLVAAGVLSLGMVAYAVRRQKKPGEGFPHSGDGPP